MAVAVKMPEAEVSCCQCSALAVSHTCAPLGQPCLRFLLVWHTASKIPQCPGACARSAERCNSVHLDAESALSPQFWYSEHEANTLGKPGEETGPEVLAGRAGQGYVPNLDWFARQDSGPVWPANQCESRCDQTGPLLVRRKQVSGITGPTIST